MRTEPKSKALLFDHRFHLTTQHKKHTRIEILKKRKTPLTKYQVNNINSSSTTVVHTDRKSRAMLFDHRFHLTTQHKKHTRIEIHAINNNATFFFFFFFSFFFSSSLLLSGSTRRRLDPQRSSGQAVVTGVVPSPPRVRAFNFYRA